MFIERKAYNEMLEWKKTAPTKYTLKISGSRQVGKTELIRHFCMNEFLVTLEFNLMQKKIIIYKGNDKQIDYLSDEDFNIIKKSPMIVHDFMKKYQDITDSSNCCIFIDEIQESTEIYNKIRNYTRGFNIKEGIRGTVLCMIFEIEKA